MTTFDSRTTLPCCAYSTSPTASLQTTYILSLYFHTWRIHLAARTKSNNRPPPNAPPKIIIHMLLRHHIAHVFGGPSTHMSGNRVLSRGRWRQQSVSLSASVGRHSFLQHRPRSHTASPRRPGETTANI